MVSLANLNTAKAAETPFEFELIDGLGVGTGVFLLVLGDESDTVRAATAALLNERRRADAFKEARRAKSRAGDQPTFTPVEDDLEFGFRVTAAKVVGWRGIEEDFTPERALELVRTNAAAAAQIAEKAGDLANFTPASQKA